MTSESQDDLRRAAAVYRVLAVLVCWTSWSIATSAAQPLARPAQLRDGSQVAAQLDWSQLGLGREPHWDALDARGESIANSLVQWGHLIEQEKPTAIFTASEVVVDFLSLDAETMTVGRDPYVFAQRPLWPEQTWQRESIRGFVFRWPIEVVARDRLRDELRTEAPRDRIWLRDGEFLDGELQSSSGDDGRVDSLQLLSSGQQVTVPLQKILAIRFASSDVARRPTSQPVRWEIGLIDGTHLAVVDASREGDESLQLTLLGGTRLTCSLSTLRRSACFFRPHAADIIWLGAVEPLDVRHVPYFRGKWDIGRDRNLTGGRIRTAAGWVDRGVSVHSTTRVAYELPIERMQLQADIGLDATAGQRGSVRFLVFARQESGEWQAVFRSDVIRGRDPPVALRVSIQRAAQLALIVEFADDGDILDRACWFGARLVPLGED